MFIFETFEINILVRRCVLLGSHGIEIYRQRPLLTWNKPLQLKYDAKNHYLKLLFNSIWYPTFKFSYWISKILFLNWMRWYIYVHVLKSLERDSNIFGLCTKFLWSVRPKFSLKQLVINYYWCKPTAERN